MFIYRRENYKRQAGNIPAQLPCANVIPASLSIFSQKGDE
jgi:hypothetical protein